MNYIKMASFQHGTRAICYQHEMRVWLGPRIDVSDVLSDTKTTNTNAFQFCNAISFKKLDQIKWRYPFIIMNTMENVLTLVKQTREYN